MEIIITEECPVPIVEMSTVPGEVFVYLGGAYSDWLNEATKREVDRLKAAGGNCSPHPGEDVRGPLG